MLTPQDIQDVKFDRSMKGYDKEQVEEFLDAVQSDYTALYKENATLKGKMRVLVDKIEEYRQVDEQMRKAFYNAQVTAQETISKAQAEAELILRNARGEAEGRVNDIRAQVAAEEQRLAAARAECQKYAVRMRQMMEDDIRVIGEHMDRMDALMEKPAVQLLQQEDAAEPAEATVQKTAPAAPAVSEEEQNAPSGSAEDVFDLEKDLDLRAVAAGIGGEDEEPEDPAEIRFSELRFGKNYKEYKED